MTHIVFHNQSEVFERVVCGRQGELFRIRFVVFEQSGLIRGRVLSCEKVMAISGTARPLGLQIAGQCGSGCPADTSVTSQPTVSPFLKSFDFLTEIKIRAPAA